MRKRDERINRQKLAAELAREADSLWRSLRRVSRKMADLYGPAPLRGVKTKNNKPRKTQ